MLIALGVTGGIGAYKAVEVVRGLQKRGHEVVAVMTASAARFVGPVTFEAITGRRVITDQFEPGANADIEHIALASTIDLLLIAPATANIIGRMANGIADDFLSTLYTATRAPVLVAPAIANPMRPLERLPMYRTGSRSSYVGPAVTSTRRPRSGPSGRSTDSAAATISSGSARRPLPIHPHARYPSPGSTNRTPRAARVSRFLRTASCWNMCV